MEYGFGIILLGPNISHIWIYYNLKRLSLHKIKQFRILKCLVTVSRDTIIFLVHPSCPKSSVNFCSFPKSSSLTVFFWLDNDRLISCIVTTGSNSFSPGTSIQDISNAPGVPGEHGVNRSLTITFGSSLEGPRT